METVVSEKNDVTKKYMGYLLLCTSSDAEQKKLKMHHLRLSVKRIFPFISQVLTAVGALGMD